ncbi:T9SS type A sorting domain-containing protein [bacterium]|nr:T9SS type A sorting domain-containing protein [bacterium]
MVKRTAIIGMVMALLLTSTVSALASDRAVLAELFGSTGCGYCPNACEALVNLQQNELSTDQLVVLYYHVSDIYATGETYQRAAYYGVGGIPHVEFDAVQQVIGAGPTIIDTYRPIVNARLAVASSIEIDVLGTIVAEGTRGTVGGTVTAKFKATDTVGLGDLVAQFVVYEELNLSYPYTVRDMLPSEAVTTLNAAGDSVVFVKNFSGVTNSTGDPLNMHVVVFIEDQSPQQIVNAALMPDPYSFEMVATHHADEIDFWGQAEYTVYCTNTGTADDTYTIDFSTDFPGDPYNWVGNYCTTGGICYMGAHDFFIAAGATETLDVHIMDYNGTLVDKGVLTLSSTSLTNGVVTEADFVAFCETPAILIVDDDGPMMYETYIQDALTGNGYYPYTVSPYTDGTPGYPMLAGFYAVFWTTASRDALTITDAAEQAMVDYLDAGGNLCLMSMNYLSSRASTNTLITDYLNISSWTNDTSGFVMEGVAADMISDGMSLGLLSGPFPNTESDSFVTTSDVIFTASGVGDKALKVSENDHKIVFFAFPFENVRVDLPDPNNQRELVEKIMAWFDFDETGVNDEPSGDFTKLALRQNTPNPFNPVTNINFTVPANAGAVELRVYNVNGRLVRTLVDGEIEAGPHTVVWNGRDSAGRSVATGVYFARLSSAEEIDVMKMALLK